MHDEKCNNRCNPIPACGNHPARNHAANAFQDNVHMVAK
jgi:hypothetical protein